MSITSNLRGKMRTEFSRNFFTLFSANALAQGISLLFYPLIARLYSAEEYGVMTLFLSISGVMILISTLRYEDAILLPQKEEDSLALFHWCLILNACFCFVWFLVMFIAVVVCNEILGNNSLFSWIWLMPLYVFTSVVGLLYINWLNRNKRYQTMGMFVLAQSSAGSLLKFIFGIVRVGEGLVLGTVIGSVGALLSVLFNRRKQICLSLSAVDKGLIKNLISAYSDFPKYVLPHSLINYLGNNVPILLLSCYFSSKYIGFYGMSIVLALSPVTLITSTLYKIMYQKLTEKKHQSVCMYPFVRAYLVRMAAVFVPVFVFLAFTIPMIVRIILGDYWQPSGHYIQIVLPWMLIVLLASPLSFVSRIFQKQRSAMWLEALYTFCRILALCIGIMSHDFTITMALFVGVTCFFVLWQLIWYVSLIRNYDRTLSADTRFTEN